MQERSLFDLELLCEALSLEREPRDVAQALLQRGRQLLEIDNIFVVPHGRDSTRVLREILPDHVAGEDSRDDHRSGSRLILAARALGRVLGVVHFVRESEEPFTPRETQLARLVAALIGVTAELARERAIIERAKRHVTLGELAAGVAHDLAAPVSYIGINLDFVAGSTDAAIDDDVRAATRDARDGLEQVRFVLASMRTVIAPATERPAERVNCNEVVQMALRITAAETRASCEIARLLGKDVVVLGQAGALVQILVNLVMNAAQANGSGADRVTLAVSTRRVGDKVIVEVADDGPGMPADVLECAFDSSFTTKPEGSGLGLAICRELAERMGGTIRLTSEVGRGTTATVELPAAAPVAESDMKTPESEANDSRVAIGGPPEPLPALEQRCHVLLIDRNENFRRAFTRSLGRYHEVTGVASLDEAKAVLARRDDAAVIFCGLEGAGTRQSAHHRRFVQELPSHESKLVFLLEGGDDRWRARQLGEVPVLEKPPQLNLLRAMVDRLVARARTK